MRTIERYVCEICANDYAMPEEAARCERRGRTRQRFKAGSIVTAGRTGFGWFDGNVHWISNPGVLKLKNPEHKRRHCSNACCLYAFYYVVAAVERPRDDPHGIRYHLFTGAMTSKHGWQSGFTSDSELIHLVKTPPKRVVLSANDFIGTKTNIPF